MLAFALFMLPFLVLIILEKYCEIFFILIFQAFLEKNMNIWVLHYPTSTKLQILIELTNTNKCSSFEIYNKVLFCDFIAHFQTLTLM